MVQLSIIEAQLTKLGVKKTFYSKPEIRQLQHILMDNEQIIKFVAGRYSGGFAILTATEQRLLLVDKKPLYLTVEDIRYDMISEVHISAQLFNATLTLFTVNKQLAFSSTRQNQLRDLTNYLQKRVMELRQYHQEPAMPDMAPQAFMHPAYSIQSSPINYVPSQVVSTSRTPPSPPTHAHHLMPSINMHKLLGSAVLHATRRHNPNPYTKAPLMMQQSSTIFS